MAWWVVTLKPNRKAPYLVKCEDEDDADERVVKAEKEGLTAEKYHTGTDNIYEAKRFLRKKVAEDFGYTIGNSNYRRD